MASRSWLAAREEESLARVAEIAGVDLTQELFTNHASHSTHDLKLAWLLKGLAEEIAGLRERVAELEKAATKDAA